MEGVDMPLTIGLLGFGRTGRVVAEEVIRNPRYKLSWVIRKSKKNIGDYASHLLGAKSKQGIIFSADSINIDEFLEDHGVDVMIDFSNKACVKYYEAAVKRNIKIVSAISDYTSEDINTIRKMSKEAAILYSPNITIGINFLIVASQILKKIAPYADVEIVEEHFREKQGTSGTALRVADLLGLSKEKQVNSIRVGGSVGRHEVIFGFPNQTIRMVHESINRTAFAKGAMYAAKWLIKKRKGLFSMEKVISADFLKYSKNLSKDL